MQNARTQSLDPSLVAALIRQESEFNPKALSRAKAYGLTQVLPRTGRTLARKAGMRTFSSGCYSSRPPTCGSAPSICARCWTSSAETGKKRWRPTTPGKSRATNWRTWGEWREPAEFVESIPFTETHDYVQSVLRNAELYRKIYGFQ